ncbi:helix-turn-helix transcriptional regulator [Flavobacterium zepuense]|uniref:Helix-turn-helix transcriptional regulator n=1 Tax=Flavobacterium zepuense TaxID=2593302 RepID=A0A552V470_9FLAO|nr:AraC family transcriptional regulator [Flavobacterium zepuense]TRW25248.1 helix-turn-helix transcriptional regulator [Flavobacterium zepuense]
MDKNTHKSDYIGNRFTVPAEWDTVFTHFYYGENTGKTDITKILLPDFKPLLVFNFGSPMQIVGETEHVITDVAVTSPLKRVVQYSMSPGSVLLVANFKDDAFYRFFGTAMPAGHLFMHPDKLIDSKCFSLLHGQLKSFAEPEAKINYLLNYAKAFIADSTGLFDDAPEDDYFNPIKVIAQKSGLSERSIQLQYKKQLGYSAKELTRFARFQKVLSSPALHLPKGDKVNWFDVIEAFGYYDQSHLIADFKYYIGLSPLNYIRLQQEFCNPPALS